MRNLPDGYTVPVHHSLVTPVRLLGVPLELATPLLALGVAAIYLLAPWWLGAAGLLGGWWALAAATHADPLALHAVTRHLFLPERLEV